MKKEKIEILEDTISPNNNPPVVYVKGGKAYVDKIDNTTRFGRHLIKKEEQKK